jgi:hypothetical protein
MYESLLREATQQGIDIVERKMPPRIKGLYSDGVIWINRELPTVAEKACIFAEELGHHHTTVGDILDQSKISNLKQEKRARAWAYERLVPLKKIIDACRSGVHDRHELAEYLGIAEEFLQAAVDHYRDKHGLYVKVDKYIIYFNPLSVVEPNICL